MVSTAETGSVRAANTTTDDDTSSLTPLLLVPPSHLAPILIAHATSTIILYLVALAFAHRKLNTLAHRGERYAWRHHMSLLQHVAILDIASTLLISPLELLSLSAHGVWWPLIRDTLLCRSVLGLDTFINTSTNYGLAALALHATSLSPLLDLQNYDSSSPRLLRCLKLPISLPLIWTMAALLSAPLYVFGQLLPNPEGGEICSVMLPPRAGWDRLLMALFRAVFTLGVPLVLLVISGVRAAQRLCSKTTLPRLNILILLWTITFALFSLHRALFATIFAFQQVFTAHPTHSVPPFVSITSPRATLTFAALHYYLCSLRPLLYCITLRPGVKF